MIAEPIAVRVPYFPTLAEFEAAVDRAHSPGVYRTAFVEAFFDEMLSRRMNCDTEGLIHEVALKTAQSLSDAYEANVSFDGCDPKMLPPSYVNVATFVSKVSFNDERMKDVIDEALKARLMVIAQRHDDGLIVFDEDQQVSSTINEWLDLVELLHGTDEYLLVVRSRREMTILARSYELLVAQVVTSKGR